MLPWRPCSRRLRSRVLASSSLAISGSEPGPFGLRCSGGTGGSLLIRSSFCGKSRTCPVVPSAVVSEHVPFGRGGDGDCDRAILAAMPSTANARFSQSFHVPKKLQCQLTDVIQQRCKSEDIS